MATVDTKHCIDMNIDYLFSGFTQYSAPQNITYKKAMHYKYFLTASAFLIIIGTQAQTMLPTVPKKVGIMGINLCESKMSDLQKLSTDFNEVDVEEMDTPKGCLGQDSRYVAGKGFYSKNYKGIIFQKDQNSEYIGKIRLTQEFDGKLPDGKHIIAKDLLLKNVFQLYPLLKKNWYSRGCSNYWQFSNDTISFYVKIDTRKTPQFPIDENYYLDKHVEGIDLVMSCYRSSKEEEKYISSILVSEPIYFVDSIKTTKGDLMKYDPSQIATLTVYKDKSATDILGGEGVNGLIYIETKALARKRYWRFFKSKSRKYFEVVPQPGSEDDIIYILNGKVLRENFEGDLSAINDTNFIEISILNKQNLINNLSIDNKRWGISIKSKLITNKTIK